jgi:hypothetical protein
MFSSGNNASTRRIDFLNCMKFDQFLQIHDLEETVYLVEEGFRNL